MKYFESKYVLVQKFEATEKQNLLFQNRITQLIAVKSNIRPILVGN